MTFLPAPRAWQAILGGICIHLCIGTLYCWGSISVYVTSYLRFKGAPVTPNDTIVVYGAAMLGQAASLYLSGIAQRRFGPRLTAFAGGWLLALSVLATSQVTTLAGMTLWYGVVFGSAIGLTYTAPLTIGFSWLPQQKGLVSGCIVAGEAALYKQCLYC
jgi:MFS transporter, OFA family, oxalate/formate antiporter